jgi:RHS repeat-associated protein
MQYTTSTVAPQTYTYGDAARPDRLTNVSDAGNAAKGFKFTSGAAAYTYDLNGNLTQDNHKGLSLGYNYLNLPNYITNPGGSEITVTYTADGEKLRKISPAGTRNYISGIEYLGTALDAIYHAEGRCTPNGASAFYYEYTLKDHLGNARINFRANGAAVTFLQELHYYPFGMVMEGIGTAKVTDNGYKYNGKELNDDLGLNLSDYGARWYDANLGRWWGVDPMGEKYGAWSGYNYGMDNPIRFIDPDGMAVTDWYKDQDGMIIHDSKVKSQVDLGDGQTYLGESHVEEQAGYKTYYSEGGGIFFQSGAQAIDYMDKFSPKTHKEILGFIFSDGVATAPYENNKANDGSLSNTPGWSMEFGEDGNTYLRSPNYTHDKPIIGTIHTHNAEFNEGEVTKPSDADAISFTKKTPNKPFFVIENDGKIYGQVGNRNLEKTRQNPWGMERRETRTYNVIDVKKNKISIQKIARNERM